MFPFIVICGKAVPVYSIMMITGALCAALWVKFTERKRELEQADVELTLIYSSVGALAGAKLLYILTIADGFKADLIKLITDPGYFSGEFLQKYFYGGYVFYGGLIGAVVAAVIYCHIERIDIDEMSRWVMPVLPLVHAFGRIGCFCMGCCYGIRADHFGLTFYRSPIAPNGVPLVPVQLMEAGAEFILFVVMACMAIRGERGRSITALWLVCYGITRFLLEFLRGDAYRGFVGALSISQVISLFIMGAGITLMMKNKRVI
ncbi:MAG: prolipoprotein diacylglyceryl transferase [Firmicutes bacterium]|nr:prolipoprotein diacylglyceryl transferase [Bacillota bacterium]